MREKLGSRLGFLMMAAGSAVGLGNVWRFPYVVGKNGGAAFVVIYLLFLALLGFPLLAAELGIGRGANRSLSAALGTLAPQGGKKIWTGIGAVLASGCFVLMIYYTDVAGWLLKYTSDFSRQLIPADPKAAFGALLADSTLGVSFMVASVVIATVVCLAGVVKGVERVTKWMMIALLSLLVVLAAKALTLPGAKEGIEFYLKPDWSHFMAHPWESIFDAMGQAFFTLSLGIGSMTICGSYVGERHSLVKETVYIIVIDTIVALLAGLVIFPACFSYGVNPAEGPGLIFVAMPQVFAQMSCGWAWGAIFFLFLSFAALTTVIAVFECLIAGLIDSLGWRRLTAALTVGVGVAVLSLPCILFDGVLDWEDFAVSQLWLPIGALIQGLFVVNSSVGWGWKSFRESVSIGSGWNMPDWMRWHYAISIPLMVGAVLIVGLWQKFAQ